MADVVLAMKEIIQKTLNKDYLYNVILLLLITIFAVLIWIIGVGVLTLVFAVPVFFVLGLGVNFVSVFLLFLLALVWFLALLIFVSGLSALILGLEINLVRDFFTKGEINFNDLFEKTKPHLWTVTKLNLVISIAYLLVVFVFLAMLLLGIAGSVGAFISDPIVFFSNSPLFLTMFLFVVLLFLLFNLFVSPFLLVVFQIPFFEATDFKKTISRAIELGRKNYIDNLVFGLLMFGVAIIVTFVSGLTETIGNFFENLLSGFGFPGQALLFVIGIVLLFVSLAIDVCSVGLKLLFQVKIYLMDIQEQMPYDLAEEKKKQTDSLAKQAD